MATILLIEDEAQTRKMLRQMLECDGYDILEAPDGKSGMDLYQEKQADLIILNVPHYQHLGYRFGTNLVKKVIKRGQIVAVN